ncbi:hypothetical protein ABT272_41755 [Streptomyces sp900105245]|uniref:Uncharacterized protein n=1 Tax=Streptomyces sp. 900105245 TaxID=3154379 RepID=A0ABV1UK91_9ACTN
MIDPSLPVLAGTASTPNTPEHHGEVAAVRAHDLLHTRHVRYRSTVLLCIVG